MSTETAPRPAPQPGGATAKRQLIVGKGWFQGIAIVMIIGFLGMGILAYRTYTAQMPLPDKVVTESGQTLFTGDDITHGQQVFQARGLQQYGSVVGHGAYLGPDYTAQYLRKSIEIVQSELEAEGKPADHDTIVEHFRTNRYDPDTKALTFTPEQVEAFDQLTQYYSDFYGVDSTENGLPPKFITDQGEIRDITAFYAWTAWSSAADRPGHDYSYTNNWPSEPRVDNGPSADLVVWSVIPLIVLLGGTGAMFAIYGRWSQKIGWQNNEARIVNFRQPGEVAITPSQKATVFFFFFVVSALFLVQTLVGAGAEHYRADMGSFYGIDLARLFPYNLLRTWHVQLSIFWTASSFLAAGVFLVPLIAKREPKHQEKLTYALLGALAIVVFGSLISEWLSVFGVFDAGSWWSNQWEWLDLPRVWQVLLTVGMFLWIFIIWRGMRARLKTDSVGNMPWMFFFAGLAIPAFYAVGLLAKSDTQIAVADFWRFWVVHLWVEDFLELFTTVMVAYIFVLLGVVRERIALGIILLDVILYSMGGVIGTMHHLYFSGTPVEAMALGSFFSAAEVIPLTFLTVEAWAFLQLGARHNAQRTKPFPHRWAVMFLVGVGFWNFVGAGIFGFLINLPVVSYYEIGTGLTANHAHASMMGVYGMLAVGLAMFCLRYMIPADKWPEKAAKWSFWLLNIGLAWMVFASLLPLGILQLYHSVSSGYYEARDLGYITEHGNMLLEWFRLPGDVIFMAGVLPFLWICIVALRNFFKIPTTREFDESPLFDIVDEADLADVTAGGPQAPGELPNSRYASDRREDD